MQRVNCSTSLYSDDDDHDDNNIQAVFPRGINPKPSYARHNTNKFKMERVNCSTSLYSDDDDHDDNNIQAVFPRGINPKPSYARHNQYRSIEDSSESENDQGHVQLYKHNKKQYLSSQPRRPTNDISSLLRMMLIDLNQRSVDAGAGAGGSKLIINRNRRSVLDYADTTDDEGQYHHPHKQTILHFSHPHALNKYNIASETNCKVCGLQLDGSAYGCQSCQFYLHTSCFDLPQKIQHDAHTAHPLTLRYPSYYKHCGKTCDACYEGIRRSFLYCCDLCNFDLHVTCATLYSLAKRSDTSKDTLRLYYTFPDGNNNITVRCNVCSKKVPKEGWLYYSKDSGYIAHIKCAKGAKVGPAWIKERLNMLKIN